MKAAGSRVAVIGGGIAGLSAGYFLSRRHEVTLFERTGRLGGNAYSHTTAGGDTVDIAVAAFGRAGYKEFYALLDELGIETAPCATSYLSFHDMDSRRGLYLTPSAEKARFQGFELFMPAKLTSLARLLLGLQRASLRLRFGSLRGRTLRACLQDMPEFGGDARVILLCSLALLSSMEIEELLDAPAEFFLGKLETHHDVISPKAAYSVRCVRHGTRRYVNALAAPFRRRVRFGARIRAVERGIDGAVLRLDDGSREAFDAVVLACNPDQALALLAAPTRQEQALLGAWRYKDGRVVVHRDHSAFPPRPLIEAYTFLYRNRGGRLEASVNGALWHEPQADPEGELISAQHPNYPIRPDLVELETVLRTPVFDFESTATIPKLPSLNGGVSFFCGSYFGYGLHEDAVASAKAVAARFGCA